MMIKPDGVQRRLMGEIISRFEKGGIKIVAMKFLSVSREMAERHYAIHKGKKFYENLIAYITSGPVLVMILEGNNVIKKVRKMVGATDPNEAESGTIRGAYAQEIGRNIVHASDSPETAQQEIALWFREKEVVMHTRTDEKWLFEK